MTRLSKGPNSESPEVVVGIPQFRVQVASQSTALAQSCVRVETRRQRQCLVWVARWTWSSVVTRQQAGRPEAPGTLLSLTPQHWYYSYTLPSCPQTYRPTCLCLLLALKVCSYASLFVALPGLKTNQTKRHGTWALD